MSPLVTRRSLAVAQVLAVQSLLTWPVSAHHSPAMFDMNRDVLLEGTITEISWRNPHVYFEIEVAGADGRKTTQQIEAGPASNLMPLGIDADSLRNGERVTVQVETEPPRRRRGARLAPHEGRRHGHPAARARHPADAARRRRSVEPRGHLGAAGNGIRQPLPWLRARGR